MKDHRMGRITALLSAAVSLCTMALPVSAAQSEETGWQKTANGYIYVTENGFAATGETVIDGNYYLFAPNGILQTGWQTVGGLRYYYVPETHSIQYGWIQWRDAEYYVTKGTGKATGITQTDLGLCFFDEYGVLRYGWQTDADGNRYYADINGVLTTGEVVIDAMPYLFDDNGIQLLGWQTIHGNRYYFNEEGNGRYQWLIQGDCRYYLTPETGAYVGEHAIDGLPYAFDENGVQYLEWYTFSDGSVAYFDPDTGDAVTGMQSIDGSLYYFSDDYRMQTGFQTIADAVYYFTETGSLQTGFFEADGSRYYSDADGVLQTGWLTVEGNRYYCDEAGVILTAWQTIDGITYYFNPMGMMCSGWQFIDGYTYYFDEDGTMLTGIITVKDKHYALDAQGRRMGEGWFDTDDARYFCNADGTLFTGWRLIDGKYYYFNSNGTMAVSTTVDSYIIDENGVASTALRTQVAKLLQLSGTNANSIYTYTSTNYRYRRIEDTRTFAELEAAGWDTLVEYTLANGRGVCYYLAATTDYFLQLAGYQTRIVYATHNTGDHYWCQAWYNGAWHNYDPTFTNRCDLPWNEIITRGSYTVYGFAQISYNERGDYLGISYEPAS